ncbi:MAG: DUF4440 domain-containing protein [Calditrichaceae bacterium]
MKEYTFLLVAIGLYTLGGCVSEPDHSSELTNLVMTERKFAAASVEKGTNEAFLDFIADESVIFRPHPVNGKTWLQEHRSSKGLLTWRPVNAAISSSADLGYTTGPWEYRTSGDDSLPAAYGQYVTIWKKQNDGSWKFIFDIGISHPKPASTASDWLLSETKSATHLSADAKSLNMLKVTDDKYSEYMSVNDLCMAMDSFYDDNIIFLRNGHDPVTGSEIIPEKFGDDTTTAVYTNHKIETSSAGDFGYSYGHFQTEGLGENSFGYYLRIWKKDASGAWKTVLDISAPAPSPDSGKVSG